MRWIVIMTVVSTLVGGCATGINTIVKKDSELASIKKFSVLNVKELRGSDVASVALASSLRKKGFIVDKQDVLKEDAIFGMTSAPGTDGVIYGYVSRIDQRSWVTEGEERIRIRETPRGTEERIRYEPPTLIVNKTIYVRLMAFDSRGESLLWETEGHVSDDVGADDTYIIEGIIEKMLGDLPVPAAEPSPAPALSGGQNGLVGESAPDFVAETIDGEKIALSQFRGEKVVILNFWGIRCLPCIQEMPKLEDIYNRYKDDGLEILAVNVDGVGAEIIKKNLTKRIGGVELNVTYPLFPDEEFEIIDAYCLTVAPLTVLIDREGIIRYRHTDYQPGDEEELEAAVKRILR